MLCTSCNVEVPSSFKHAIAKNECPSCGGVLMDEEMMAIIDDIGKTVASEVTLREEALKKIAMAIATQYNISLRGQIKPVKQSKPAPKVKKEEEKADIIDVPEVEEGISDKEREHIMEEAIKTKYNMVDQISLEDTKQKYPDTLDSPDVFSGESGLFEQSSVLEKERMMRLAKQQQAINSGQSAFRRSS